MRVTCDYVNGVDSRQQCVTLEMTADEAVLVAQAFDAANRLAEIAVETHLANAVEVPSLLVDTADELRHAASMLP